ncbi:hypothetical protein [Mycobacterium branderi]|uniref:Uncharacterized protein n=1 Tax=Mycobacterium branderi TaxID=43348 RepID=A0A7I7WBQ4_9MYCO|nr:hypothetical protein [Mycobacterium branderi]MCV7235263.1 hypothetical protein [Mycobacterium branderi]ORA29860.1 hypothetical protein BST20_27805 [Mycobacterium branderi]BBZ15036.1 hypothetical protein MBRA_52310 [Mycobacterium branderi]
MNSAFVKRSVATATMTAFGVMVGLLLWVATMYVLIPFLLFAAMGAAPFVALLIAGTTAALTASRPCRAPAWAERHRLAFWVGTFATLVFVCIGIAATTPQMIPFWPT